MEARIKFSADVYIQGETLDEIRDKWVNMRIFSDEAEECGASFNDHLLIENAETNEDISSDFWACDSDIS